MDRLEQFEFGHGRREDRPRELDDPPVAPKCIVGIVGVVGDEQVRTVGADERQVAVSEGLDDLADRFLPEAPVDPHQLVLGMQVPGHGEVLALETADVEKAVGADQYVFTDHGQRVVVTKIV